MLLAEQDTSSISKVSWLKQIAQREEDRKKERTQLLAMKKKKEDIRIHTILLSPVFKIPFTPSTVAQKILGVDPTRLSSPAYVIRSHRYSATPDPCKLPKRRSPQEDSQSVFPY